MAALPQRPVAKTPFKLPSQPIPSSSPAFATPVHPIRPAISNNKQDSHRPAPILPILLPPAILRPIAFRTFTKKHNLTLTSVALQALSAFIGKHCGSGWREEGLAELVLEEIARAWKRSESKVIVDGEGSTLANILKQLEGSMSGGRIVIGRNGSSLSRQTSLVGGESFGEGGLLQRGDSFGISALGVEEDEESEEKDPRSWLKVVGAFEMPRMMYNPSRNHFEKSKSVGDMFPPPSMKTDIFRQRYHLIHQRVLRSESFQKTSTTSKSAELKITSIANLLGRSGTGHLLLGLLMITPTGTLAVSDLTGTISLDLEQATFIDPVETWLCPGMIVLVHGVYEEEYGSAGGNLGGTGGVGGTIGGRFTGFSIGAPRCETRATTLGITDTSSTGISAPSDMHIGGGFGWVDFLGQGSERAIGSRMRKIEQRLLSPRATLSSRLSLPPASIDSQPHTHTNSNKLVILGSVHLDSSLHLTALRRILLTYAPPIAASPPPPPLTFVLLGPFVSHAAMSNTTSSSAAHATTTIPDSITYKEAFDSLAALLSDFPTLLRSSTWIFVPGDNDPWASSFSAGASVPLPRSAIPEMFTTRVKRAFAAANAAVPATTTTGVNAVGSAGRERVPGEAVWTTNPARVTLFGPSHEIVLFRDDVSGRLRRTAVGLKKEMEEGRVDEGYGSEEGTGVVDTTMVGALDGGGEQMDVDADVTVVDENDTNQQQTPPPPPPPPQKQKQTHDTSLRHARSLVKTLLDQGTLSPFPLSTRPLHWAHAHALSLYPLPSALVLCDTDADALVVRYQGCCVMNAGRLVGGRGVGGGIGGRGGGGGGEVGRGGKRGGREVTSWVEYDVSERKAEVRLCDL